MYYIHPYSPPLRGFENLLKTLLQGKDKIILSATLFPTTLTKGEMEFLQGQIAFCEGYKLPDSGSIRIYQNRANSLSQALLRQYLLLQDAPFYLTFNVASSQSIDSMLLEYIGLAITEPIGQGIQAADQVSSYSFHVGGYDIVLPLTKKDCELARINLSNLMQDPWAKTQLARTKQRFRNLFDGNEAVSAFYFPINADEDLPGVEIHHLEERPVPRAMLSVNTEENEAILIGKNHYYGFEQDVVIPIETRRQHTYVIGQTGTGKTTLLKTMILSDIRAGNGLAVIDPHGEMYWDLLEYDP